MQILCWQARQILLDSGQQSPAWRNEADLKLKVPKDQMTSIFQKGQSSSMASSQIALIQDEVSISEFHQETFTEVQCSYVAHWSLISNRCVQEPWRTLAGLVPEASVQGPDTAVFRCRPSSSHWSSLSPSSSILCIMCMFEHTYMHLFMVYVYIMC